MQHGVRIEAVFASLQQGEHMVESTCFQHTSSHPDKYNNSANRIISKEEEREDPRRDTSVFFEYSGVSTYNPFYKNYSVSTRNPASFQSSRAKTTILHTELILPQEILQLQGSCRADHYKVSSSDCSPCTQAFYMAE